MAAAPLMEPVSLFLPIFPGKANCRFLDTAFGGRIEHLIVFWEITVGCELSADRDKNMQGFRFRCVYTSGRKRKAPKETPLKWGAAVADAADHYPTGIADRHGVIRVDSFSDDRGKGRHL